MLLTEEEAEKKECPRMRLLFMDIAYTDILCIGSKCMAWRQQKEPFKAEPIRGYCGLAGKPE